LGGFFECGAGELAAVSFGAVEGYADGGGGVIEPCCVDVRDAVAVGVGAAGGWVPGDVSAERVG